MLLLLGCPLASPEESVDPFYVPRPPDLYEKQGITAPQADQADGTEPPPPGLVRQIGADFKNVFTRKENLFIAGAGLGAAGTASYFDDEIVSSRFNSEMFEGGSLDKAFEAGEVLGSATVQVGGAFATYGFGKLFSNPGVQELGRDLVRAQIVTQTLTQALKVAVRRERPDGSNQKSFPSGHASGSFATATVLQRHYGWKVGIPAYAVAGYIASSRLSEARHYLSDVVFGAAVGTLVGRTVTVDLGKNRFAVSPLLVLRGAGLQFTWLGPT